MIAIARKWTALALGALLLLGCEVTSEQIELWKGTKNGPKKLAATAIDKKAPVPIRAKAVVALSEIRDRDDEDVWDIFLKVFQKMAKADAEPVVDAAIEEIAKKVSDGPKGAISKSQVGAKDALFVMLDYASKKGRATAEKALIAWCTEDYNIRALAGKYNIRAIVKKIGPPAAEALIPLLKVNEIAVKFIAELIRDIKDETVLVKASAGMAGELGNNISKIEEIHLVAAATIGEDPIAELFLNLANDPELDPKIQRLALRAFAEGLQSNTIDVKDEHVNALFSVAENAKLDRAQREEAYFVIARANRESDAQKIRRLLKSKDGDWRSVGLHCLLQMGKEDALEKTLKEIESIKLTKTEEDVDDIVVRVMGFPALLPSVRKLLENDSPFLVGIAVGVIAEVGDASDVEPLKKLKDEDEDLPKGFRYETVSKAAQAALAKLKERGHN